ncbi:Na+/H+-dicarboxylate symporter [Streptomyces umbrinus]|uniref:Na+/H+-dicarboxylate symporter n=1 Tax=Streptomyces umbrinus TaxID=67370 RepID=A0ABU0T3M6_9ACTN|nr:Na+/H+-dicarboxylate symporter [Streptomyces umbrinus]
MPPSVPSLPRRAVRKLRTSLFAQVACALVLGILVGKLWPDIATAAQPLGDGFIRLIMAMISPLVFCVVVVGITKAGDLKAFGRIGLKALIWFEVATTFALLFGLIAGNLVQPGAGMNVDPSKLDAWAVDEKTGGGSLPSTSEFILHSLPDSAVGAFAENSLLCRSWCWPV